MHEPAVKGMDTRNKKVEFMFRLEKSFNTFSNPYFLIWTLSRIKFAIRKLPARIC